MAKLHDDWHVFPHGSVESVDDGILTVTGRIPLPLVELEQRPIPADLRERVGAVRGGLLDRIVEDQAHWWSWTPHGAMRLARARIALGPTPARAAPLPPGHARGCDGALYQTDPSAQIDVPALTGTPAQ